MPTESETADYASTHASFYELLGITADAQSSDVRRAYRKTSIKYHPDKNPDDPKAADKFHLLTIALEVLSDAALRSAYDNALNAKVAKKRRTEAYDTNRRKMKDDLEERERGAKRAKTDEDERKREFERLKEEGAKKRQEMDERKRKQAEEEQAAEFGYTDDAPPLAINGNSADASTTTSKFSELDRTIRARWKRKGVGETLEKADLITLFSKFGAVEECVVVKSLKKAVQKEKEKKYRTALLVFQNIAHAYSAVHYDQKALATEDDQWALFKDVTWASGKQPDIGQMPIPAPAPASPSFSEMDESFEIPSPSSTFRSSTSSMFPPHAPSSRPQSSSQGFSKVHPLFFATPTAKTSQSKHPQAFPESFPMQSSGSKISTPQKNIKRVPSFASFTSDSNRNTPQKSPLAYANGSVESQDYEAITMMRMRARALEKMKLEEEIRLREEEETNMEN